MTEIEVLELAAKAAGLKHVCYDSDYDGQLGLMLVDDVGRHTNTWNPLADDGDALRLAVKLKINLRFSWDGCHDQYDGVFAERGRMYCEEEIGMKPNGYEFDELEATRRAIVRAAAAIGAIM